MKNIDEHFMKIALKEANKALLKEEIPIGCVIVDENNKIIARGHNIKEQKEDVSAHAEILAIREAGKKRNNWRLNGCTIYITLEPCLMCASAIMQARLSRVVFGAREDNTGAFGSKYNILELENQILDVKKGVLGDESKRLLQGFFQNRRKKSK